MSWTHLAELASDVCGAGSAYFLVVPVHRIARAQEKLQQRRAKIQALNPTSSTGELAHMLDEEAQAAGEFDLREVRWIRVGVWLLAASFALRLLYHWLK